MGFSSLTIEFRPTFSRIPEYRYFETNSEQVGIVLDRIVGSNDPEIFADQVSNLSSAKETVLLLALLFLQTDSSFEVRILDDFVR